MVGVRPRQLIPWIEAVMHRTVPCMTMLSFRIRDRDAGEAQRWADRLGIDRSELLRRALRRHLVRLAGEHDAAVWERTPLTNAERSFAGTADWGPAEDWSDGTDAAR